MRLSRNTEFILMIDSFTTIKESEDLAMGLLFLFYQNLLVDDPKWQKILLINSICPIC